jgi:hypothetical protein
VEGVAAYHDIASGTRTCLQTLLRLVYFIV